MLNKIVCLIVLFLISCDKPEITGVSDIKITHRANYNSVDKIAVILEPRKHELLVPIVKNVMAVLGDKWKIQIFHGRGNESFILESDLRAEIDKERIFLSSLGVDNLSVPKYSKLMVSSYFWENVFGENVLVFQTDVVLCDSSPNRIEDFLSFDYVGAPWKADHFCHVYESPTKPGQRFAASNRDVSKDELEVLGFRNVRKHKVSVGNGGLSFRKRSKALKILSEFTPSYPEYDHAAEDIFWGCVAADSGEEFKTPSIEEAKKFSVETLYHASPFGVHKPWPYLEEGELDSLGDSCQDFKWLRNFYR